MIPACGPPNSLS
ncbi:hypothetical protein YPPY72_4649, partial [Yersinia pestis PY-72]